MLWMNGDRIVKGMAIVMKDAFSINRSIMYDPMQMVLRLEAAMQDALMFVAPFLGVMIIAALAGPLAMGGWAFSADAFSPKLEKLSPLKGFKRMFSPRSLIEMLKSLMKFGIVLGFMFMLANVYLEDFIGLSRLPLEVAFIKASDMMLFSFVILCLSLMLVVVVDVPFTLWEHNKKLKMTKQEVKDEMKQTEGRPEVKSKIRQLQQEMSQGRMMEQVPKADVIVTNPTHFAVALKYEEGANGAPKVVAKGADLVAAQIRNIAIANGVELISMPPLARALFHTTKIDQEVPQGLYLAVAQVLAYIFQLRIAKEKRWKKPQPPKNVKIPDEYSKYR